MTKPVIIIGVGGYSANLVDIMNDLNIVAGRELWRPIGFLDDDPTRRNGTYIGLPILGSLHDATRFNEAFFINAIGSAQSAIMKPQLIEKTGIPLDRFVTLCHPSAYVSTSAKLGSGTAITQGVVVMAQAEIGAHVKTLPLATISYGAKIGDYTTVAGGAVVAAEVSIGRSVYVGATAAIRERIIIGDNAIVGMGAIIVRNVPVGAVVVGNPGIQRQSR
jgi:sugar O-acyltransferase (sialic acid O-acetyltransferase NeuD family)